MTQNNEREALIEDAKEAGLYADASGTIRLLRKGELINITFHILKFAELRDARAISQNEQQEAVEALRERDRLGFAVVEVIGKLDEIIEVAEDIEFNDFAHIAIPLELWNELKDALDLMPERADNYTSPPKQIPDGWKLVPIEPTEEMIDSAFVFLKDGGVENIDGDDIRGAIRYANQSAPTNTEVGE